MTETLMQMVISLIFVILLIFLAAFVYKKKQRKSGLISLVEYLSIGPKKGVAALKIGREILILGITPTDFRLLKTLKEEAFIESMDIEKVEKQRIGVLE